MVAEHTQNLCSINELYLAHVADVPPVLSFAFPYFGNINRSNHLPPHKRPVVHRFEFITLLIDYVGEIRGPHTFKLNQERIRIDSSPSQALFLQFLHISS
jgi:hypothetical protein